MIEGGAQHPAGREVVELRDQRRARAARLRVDGSEMKTAARKRRARLAEVWRWSSPASARAPAVRRPATRATGAPVGATAALPTGAATGPAAATALCTGTAAAGPA